MKSRPDPPDQDQRQLIVDELDKTMLVEAAAGTGKTTGMLNRMIALIQQGICLVDTMAAVTFTRKAAAELRARFQVRLEKAAGEATGVEAERLRLAISSVERCFIGTIHSFCARLLRERPIEAGVDLAFQELDEDLDQQFREEAWKDFTDRLIAEDDVRIGQLRELGLQFDQLRSGFMKFAGYSDIQHWDAPEVDLPDWNPTITALKEYVSHMEALIPTFPMDRGTDKLMNRYEHIVRLTRNRDLAAPAKLMQVLELFSSSLKPIQKYWPGGPPQGQVEQQRWREFCEQFVDPVKRPWLAKRYHLVIDLMTGAAEHYARRRQLSGSLNYQDLLMKSADLLRDKPQVRNYFRSRFTHLLVDEFQDTDPIQAEVVMFLTAHDPNEQDWRNCQPVPGSLFVVGDPKQSIYRFRRADIFTYNQVKEVICSSGGVVVSLRANFRTRNDLVDWGNKIFMATFPAEANQYSPTISEMLVARQEGTEGELTGIHVLEIPEEYCTAQDTVEYDADQIARTIRKLLDAGATVPRTLDESKRGISPEVTPGDFLVITYRKKDLAYYGQKLQELGIPYQVTGGSALDQVPELAWLIRCLRAVTEPDNSVALVAALRSQLFGINDQQLYAFRKAGGEFFYQSTVPKELAAETSACFQQAFARLRRYNQWFRVLPAVSAMERITWDLGLTVSALSSIGGNVQAGSIAKVLEMLRERQSQFPSATQLVEYLDELMERGAEFDGLPARADREPVVRLMNLHKVKGLEAPVVFLANPTGKWSPPVDLHIDRSADQVTGYLTIQGGAPGSYHRPLLASPLGWETCQQEEKQFVESEQKRLLYVAATRAGAQLIVSQKEKRNSTSYWNFFADYLEDCPRLPDPGEQSAPLVTETELVPETVAQVSQQIAQSWEHTGQATYATGAAKEMTVESTKQHPKNSGSSQGAAWGTVIHLLLETAMQQPDVPLDSLAYTALEQQDLDVAMVNDALVVVQAVLKSDIWQRAQASEKRLVEVPFEHCLAAGDSETGLPTLVRGVIDLMFREPDGWVIVDYKTDSVTADSVGNLVDHYRGQVNGYADTWQLLTGEQVKEKGLYLTRLNQFVTVD